MIIKDPDSFHHFKDGVCSWGGGGGVQFLSS
jgi:hypothetical protein